ncbi:MAG: NAD(P)H-quinone oxidoreductase [Gammaproteobacteria bacterium]|nr:MAG: NAD(P)H-quinone oxidoreductase [Gammaproteobacteria bacterium]
MKAIVKTKENQLVWEEVNAPTLSPGHIRIDVHASAINRADLLQYRGFYPPPPGASSILGLECAGVVSEIASDVSSHQVGDSVCALLSGGGYAEQVVCHAGHAVPIPQNLSLHSAAALPEVFATAWCNLFIEAQLQPHERVLIHAGASGVGTAAIQLCKQFANPCYVTVGNEEKVRACKSLGAEQGWVRNKDSFKEQLLAQLSQDGATLTGVDVILDPVGGSYLADNMQCLNIDGRLVVIGLMGGIKSELNLAQIVSKRISIIGSALRSRPTRYKTQVMSALRDKVWPLIETDKISPIIEQTFPIQDVTSAFELLSSNDTIGKLVLQIKS